MKNGIRTGIALSFAALTANAQILITDYSLTYSEEFSILAITGTSNVLPAGWSISETGTSATVDGSYTAGTGSNTAGDAYSLGTASSTERALGTLRSGTNLPTIGALFVNNGVETLNGITLQYRGEQWRLGATGRTDRLDFQYSTDATSLSNGTWTDVNSLDFAAPNSSGSTGARDGNADGNFSTVSSALTGLNIAPGSSLWIRWMDFDAAGSDDALGIDDISVSYVTVPEPSAAIALVGSFGVLLGVRRMRK